MRPLNRNERLLAGALGAVVFLFINLAGMRWISDQMRVQKAAISQLESDAAATRTLLTQQPYWEARQGWVAAHPPDVYDDRTTRSKFLQEVQSDVQTQGLKIQSQQPLDTDRAGQMSVANIDLVLSGRLEAIVRWLHAVQQPGKYVTIGNFTLKQGDDGNSMQLQVRLGKVYRAGGPSASP
jgi:hypothetical protein